VAEASLCVQRVDLGVLRIMESAGGLGGGFSGLGCAGLVQYGDGDLDAKDAFVGSRVVDAPELN